MLSLLFALLLAACLLASNTSFFLRSIKPRSVSLLQRLRLKRHVQLLASACRLQQQIATSQKRGMQHRLKASDIDDFDVVGSDDDADMMDDEEDEDDEVLYDEDEEEGVDFEDEEEALRMDWKAKRANKRRGPSWEERFENDPLRSDSPTLDIEAPAFPYEKTVIAIGDVDSPERLKKRQEAWVHHIQWARRNALTPDSMKRIKVDWAWSRLTSDHMAPVGQIVGVHCNDTKDVKDYFKVEPLQAHGAVQKWKLFEYTPVLHENTSAPIRDPFVFVGFHKKSGKDFEQASHESLHYHVQSNSKIIKMGHFASLEDPSERGILILFNSKTNAGAHKYIKNDPLVASGNTAFDPKFACPMNEQDVDGLHHLMARTFSEKTVLEQIHFADPEDLLKLELEELPGLPNHNADNLATLTMLKEAQISYAYRFLDLQERYRETLDENKSKEWNRGMGVSQRVRLSASSGQSSSSSQGDDDLLAVVTEEDNSSSVANEREVD